MPSSSEPDQTLLNAVYHIFLPPKLPQSSPREIIGRRIDYQLATLTLEAAKEYYKILGSPSIQWIRLSIMLSRFAQSIVDPLDPFALEFHMTDMQPGDILALYIREQNAAVIIRKSATVTLFEIFEVQAPTAAVMSTVGKLVRGFPGPAIEVPNSTANDPGFIGEISSFLAQMSIDVLDDAIAKTSKAHSKVTEVRDVANPHYISQLFTGILHGFGKEIAPRRIAKRISDEVLWNNAYLPWRRSPVWLIIRVALQTSLDALDYKHFMIYLQARLLGSCVREPSFSSDLLATMRMKIARRMLKVYNSLPEQIIRIAKEASNQTEVLLQTRWKAVQKEVPRFGPLHLDLQRAITQTLPNSRKYLDGVLQSSSTHVKIPAFKPGMITRTVDCADFSMFANGALTSSAKKNKHSALFDFEHAVHYHLSAWVVENRGTRSADACVVLYSCLDQYMKAAASHYTQDTTDCSVMALTIMELWVGFDRLASSSHNILLDYSPEFPENIVEPLLLRSSLLIERARRIQMYLRSRHKNATYGSFFRSKNDEKALPVRFFRQSDSLQELKKTIEQDAQLKRALKLQELDQANAEHARLSHAVSEMECTYEPGPAPRRDHKPKRCQKCQTQKQVASMKIAVHEWPLPTRENDIEAVIFELHCPDELNIWRSATQWILCDLAGATTGARASHEGILTSYAGLMQWAKASKYRVIVASSTKSFQRSHYATVKIPSTEGTVCVNNGLNFKLFDSHGSTWLNTPFVGANLSRHGTFTMPEGSPYCYLQYSLEGVTHTSNQVIASQSDCPKEISLHEHYAFGTLRSGPRLQWMNIARGLEENVLKFNRDETFVLLAQAAWQLGPLSMDGQIREWHIELGVPEFAQVLIRQASQVLEKARANWLESITVHTIGEFVMLVTRLLSSTTDGATRQAAYLFLRNARAVTFEWVQELLKKLQSAEKDVQEFQHRICEMALICRSTYDVDESHLMELLSTPPDWTALVTCAIILYDNRPPKLTDAPERLQSLISRDRRLAFRILPILINGLKRNPRILDSPISQYWSSYTPGTQGWTVVSETCDQWVMADSISADIGGSQKVHLDVLEGRLLVNGQSFGRLPLEYINHPTYIRLFGQKIIDVVPVHLGDAFFTTRTTIQSYKVTFFLDPNKNMIIQASQGDTLLELIPHSKLAKDFPSLFLSEYHHWMNPSTGVLEFRPLDKPWTSDTGNWHLHYSVDSVSTMITTRGGRHSFLFDQHSAEFQKITAQIIPLESGNYLHVTQSDPGFSQITVELPRMKLEFFVNKDMQLESKNFRGQIIDQVQSSGTLFGLKNQLILCAKEPLAKSLPRSRSVLIPFGAVNFAFQSKHTQVTISCGFGRHVGFYHYKIDTDLGYLTSSDASLASRLFKIYLHALTSHCLPDPLTGRSGTEEALYELSEAATTSFDHLEEEEARLLQLIGSLTPQRVYYPPHLCSMQTTSWANLPALSQHYAFCAAANLVLERAYSLQIFNPLGFDIGRYAIGYNELLLKRAAHRTCIYYPVDTDGRLGSMFNFSKYNDVSYEGQDQIFNSLTEIGQRVACVSGLVGENWNQPFRLEFKLTAMLEDWKNIKGPASDLSMTYSKGWFQLELPSSWLSLHNACRVVSEPNARYGLSICLAAAVYSGRLPMSLVPVLIAFAVNPQIRDFSPPAHPEYHLSDAYDPTLHSVLSIVSIYCFGIEKTPSGKIAREKTESTVTWLQRRISDYNSNSSLFKNRLADHWMKCWPDIISMPPREYSEWFDIDGCLRQIKYYFFSCSRNTELRNYLNRVEKILSSVPVTSAMIYPSIKCVTLAAPSQTRGSLHGTGLPSFAQLVKQRVPCRLLDISHTRTAISSTCAPGSQPDTVRLKGILAGLKEDTTQLLCHRYVSDLESSRIDLVQNDIEERIDRLPPLLALEENRRMFRGYMETNRNIVSKWLGPKTDLECVVAESGLWPRLTPRVVLSKLALQARRHIPAHHQSEIIKYARSYIEYQRSHRLISQAMAGKHEEFYKELKLGNTGTGPESCHPDWLLAQIDGDFSIRTLQTQVAREMISPSSTANTVLQLNMGEGKSSVIVPIVAAVLADTTRLVRVVVLKPLWHQMFQLLVSRLSGLVNRRIYYLPFGRHIPVGDLQAKQIQDIYMECMREGGILLVQPEHVLSFKLMGVDQSLSLPTNHVLSAGRRLRDIERWLQSNARDILDESDEILHVRYQLVYTVGEQKSLEGHPDRWATIQQVLSLVAKHIRLLKQQFSDKFKYETRSGGQFPFIRIMPESDEVVANLIGFVAKDAVTGLIQNLNFGILSWPARSMALRILTGRDISTDDTKLLEELNPISRSGLLLLRGLLAFGIIAFALRDKHYRVDYGLHLSRCLSAVPYHAKDIPSVRAEFGHPDVAIVLTCLSYYNHGLTQDQLMTCFELLLKLDNPDIEYDQWVHRNKQTPPSLRLLKGVNLKDHEQFASQIVPTFSYNAAVVNFFLSWVVFPKEAKQFPYKLSTSGWDLAEVKKHTTTGFSGTNDNRYLLPVSITQSDPVKQSSTNALVLTYLLQPENNHYLCIRGASGETCSATEFMDMLVKQTPEIRVLLDVGAQMLELTNNELVKYWMKLRPDVSAAVYFNDQDELVIVPQDGAPVPFHSSPFAQQMDKCIVYLDDGHTRGTDLTLPKGTRAAVTLGPKVTKDRLLQGCMRMRKLGFGQSVMFFAPTEVDSEIRKTAKLTSADPIDTADVLKWTMLETCKDLIHHTSHWTYQGLEYHRRVNSSKTFAFNESPDVLREGWLTAESRSLQEMYGDNSRDSEFLSEALQVPHLKKRLEELGVKRLRDPGLGEEQEREREVSHEVERERQVERPARLDPAIHTVHAEIRRFVHTGQIPQYWAGVVSLFQPLKSSGALQPETWSPKLFATLDFCTTLATTNIMRIGDYMRPVNWILSGSDGNLLVLSPFEVNELLPDIRNSAYTRLHIFAPRVVQSMSPFSDLKFYSPPAPSRAPSYSPDPLLQLQIGLFAGQLYFESYAQYRAACGFLGVYIPPSPERRDSQVQVQVQGDGFVLEPDRQRLAVHALEYAACQFKGSPIPALKDLLGYRRKGMDFLKTHMGQLLHARQLTPSDF